MSTTNLQLLSCTKLFKTMLNSHVKSIGLNICPPLNIRPFSIVSIRRINQESENRLNNLHTRLEESAEKRSDNLIKLKECNFEIDVVHADMRKNLNPYVEQEIRYADSNVLDKTHGFNEKLSNLDTGNSRTEIEEIELENKKVNVKLEHTSFIKQVLTNSGVSVPQDKEAYYSELEQKKQELIQKDVTYTQEHLANVREYITTSEQIFGQNSQSQDNNESGSGNSGTSNQGNAGNSSRSLVDDYADPSTEQPSYMDPED
jgi:hypothetical protein